jgi:hypothetical protein
MSNASMSDRLQFRQEDEIESMLTDLLPDDGELRRRLASMLANRELTREQAYLTISSTINTWALGKRLMPSEVIRALTPRPAALLILSAS